MRGAGVIFVKMVLSALTHKLPLVGDLTLSWSCTIPLVMEGQVGFAPCSNAGTQADVPSSAQTF